MDLKFESTSDPELTFSPFAIRHALDRVLASSDFQKSPALSRLLRFLVENHLSGNRDLKETTVGHALYGRELTYDPKADSVVRVNASRLRNRLILYYQRHPEEKLHIELHPGSYIPTFRKADSSVPAFRLVSKNAELAVTRTIEPEDEAIEVAGDAPASEAETPAMAALPEEPQPKHDATSDPQPGPTKRSPRLLLFLCLAVLAAVCVFGAVRFTSLHNAAPAENAWTLERVSELGGEQEFATLSPDGRALAFTWRGPGEASPHIYLQDRSTGSVRRLTKEQPEENRAAWSPDGSQIAFVRLRQNAGKDVVLFSLRDGTEHKLTELTGAFPWLCEIPRLSWSRDGNTLYSSASLGPNGACGVVAIDSQRGNVRRITQPPIGTVGDLEPTIAPDGSSVAFLRNAGTMGGDIFLVDLASGSTKRLTFDNRDVMGFAWMPSGNALVVASRRDSGISRLWQLYLDTNKVVALTDGSMTAGFPFVTANGDHIYFTAYHGSASIWKLQNGTAQKLVSSPGVNYAPQLSADGKRLVYRSDRTGAAELWVSNANGGEETRLTWFNGPMVGSPRWSPSGNAILFECRPHGHSDICLLKPDGQNKPQVLTHWSANQIFPSWSKDEKSFYFTSNDSGRWEIYRQPFGGEPVQLTHGGGMRALESPQGDWLYISRGEPQGGIVRMALRDTPETAEKEIPVNAKIGPEESGYWDVSSNGVIFASTVSGSTLVQEVDGDTSRTHSIATLKQGLPPGDIVLSSSPATGAILFVKAENQDGGIDVLSRIPAKH